MTHKEMIEHIESEIETIKTTIRVKFATIAIYQDQIRWAKSAIEWHRQQADIDGILELCRSGK